MLIAETGVGTKKKISNNNISFQIKQINNCLIFACAWRGRNVKEVRMNVRGSGRKKARKQEM